MKRVFGCEICFLNACIQEAHAFPTGQRFAVALTCPANVTSALPAASANHKDV